MIDSLLHRYDFLLNSEFLQHGISEKDIQPYSFIGIQFKKDYSYEYVLNNGKRIAVVSDQALQQDLKDLIRKISHARISRRGLDGIVVQKSNVISEIVIKPVTKYDTAFDEFKVIEKQAINKDGQIEQKRAEVLVQKKSPESEQVTEKEAVQDDKPKEQVKQKPKVKQQSILSFLKKSQ